MLTKEYLEHIEQVSKEIRILNKEIENGYNTYHSPQLDRVSGRTKAANPVQSAVSRIEALKNRRDKLILEMLYFDGELIETVKDPAMSAIIRYHYVLGFNWKDTNYAVYGEFNYHRARCQVIRYLEGLSKNEYKR